MIVASHAGAPRPGLIHAPPPWPHLTGLASLLLLIAACAHEPTASEPQPFEVLDQAAWSGGTLRVTSTAFAGMATLPTVLIADTARAVTRLDSVTLAVQLPVASGTLSMRVEASGVDSTPRDIHLAGFDGYLSGPSLTSDPEIWPQGSAIPSIIAIRDGRLVRIDLRSGSPVQLLPDSDLSAQCVPVPGLSGIPELVAVAPAADSGCGPLEVFSLAPTVARVDSGPSLGPLALYQVGRPFLYLAPGKWLLGKGDSIVLMVRDAQGDYTRSGLGYGPGRRFTVSPRGDRALPVWGTGTAPVFDLPSGTVAYTIPGSESGGIEGAVFSEGGDTLFVSVGGDLHVLDAATGASLGQLTVPGYGVADMAVDPGRPWLYLLVDVNFPEVFVADRRTLTLAGRLGPCCHGERAGSPQWRAVLSPSERRLYVILADPFNPPVTFEAGLFGYTLLP